MLKLIESLNETKNSFQVKVDLETYVLGDNDFDFSKDVLLKYEIDIAYRTWGIDSMSLTPVGNIELEVENLDTHKTQTINVDLEDTIIEWKAGLNFSPWSLRLELNEDLTVSKKILRCTFIAPGDSE